MGAGFAAQVAEVAAVSACLCNEPEAMASSGATIAGVKYMFIRASKTEGGEGAEAYVKKGQTGVVFQKCKTCILVAYHDDKVSTGPCSAAVGKLADFLRENGI